MSVQRIRSDLLALLALAGTAFLAVSLASFDVADPPSTVAWPLNTPPANLCGRVGAWIAWYTFYYLGAGVWVLLCGAATAITLLLAQRPPQRPASSTLGWLLLTATACPVLDRVFQDSTNFPLPFPGGVLGLGLHLLLLYYFSTVGMFLILSSALAASLLLICDKLLIAPLAWAIRTIGAVVGRLATPLRRYSSGKTARMASKPAAPKVPVPATISPETAERAPKASSPSSSEHLAARSAHGQDRAGVPAPQLPPATPKVQVRSLERSSATSLYKLPPLDLLDDPDPFPYEEFTDEIIAQGQKLKQTLAEFGYNVELREIHTGPVVTQYEIALESGLRVGKIHSLADDLAIALKAASVRVVAPIPGKDTVGVEVPNPRRQFVRLKEVIQGCLQKAKKMEIPLFLGKDVKGNPLIYDLTQMPHLLIAGRTGTGKSVCLNALILSVLMTRTPDEVRLLMIDPKLVELSQYRRIPHLMHPVVTDMSKAEALLSWAVDKMEERYDLLARAGVRHLKAYNRLGAEEIYRRLQVTDEADKAQIPTHMPYIVIFADEMADLMMTAPKEIESHIIRLAQKSRAVGIHLVVATQKPTVDVITGLIKSNLPARICFQVSSRSDSRVVLDEMGGEKLLGNGDMLFLIPGTSQTVRAQGTFVSDQEIERVVEFLEQYEPQYSKELVQLSRKSKGEKRRAQLAKERDPLYEEAVEIVLRERRGSTSLLQRALGIGYGRAARLIDYMAEDGIVGEYNGSQAREVLLTLEEWLAMKQEESDDGLPHEPAA